MAVLSIWISEQFVGVYDTEFSLLLELTTGTILGIFEDNRYKSESKTSALKSVEIIGLGSGAEVDKKLKYAQDVSSGIILGRELVNSPANVLTPGLLLNFMF